MTNRKKFDVESFRKQFDDVADVSFDVSTAIFLAEYAQRIMALADEALDHKKNIGEHVAIGETGYMSPDTEDFRRFLADHEALVLQDAHIQCKVAQIALNHAVEARNNPDTHNSLHEDYYFGLKKSAINILHEVANTFWRKGFQTEGNRLEFDVSLELQKMPRHACPDMRETLKTILWQEHKSVQKSNKAEGYDKYSVSPAYERTYRALAAAGQKGPASTPPQKLAA